MKHVPVLLQETIDNLNLHEGSVVVDATVGGGGYTKKLCEAVGNDGTVIGIDRDSSAIEEAREILGETTCRLHLEYADFRNLDVVLSRLEIDKVDAFVFDLGMSSIQLEQSGRGFSFQKDEPLIMTFEEKPHPSDITARRILNEWKEGDIANVIYGYGEERFARRIARRIVEERKDRPINTTLQLVEIIKRAVPIGFRRRKKTHFATKTFQALRIAVNDEVEALEEGLKKALRQLKSRGRIAVVSFHSIEDRVVKGLFRKAKERGLGLAITKKPISPSKEEIEKNPRSRSAKLRVLEKI